MVRLGDPHEQTGARDLRLLLSVQRPSRTFLLRRQALAVAVMLTRVLNNFHGYLTCLCLVTTRAGDQLTYDWGNTGPSFSQLTGSDVAHKYITKPSSASVLAEDMVSRLRQLRAVYRRYHAEGLGPHTRRDGTCLRPAFFANSSTHSSSSILLF